MRVRFALGILLVWILCVPAFGGEPLMLRSHSGQFVVRGLPVGAPLLAQSAGAAVAYVRLDPRLLAVSCERIKGALLEELAAKDYWRGRVYISLHPVRQDHEPIVITSTHYADGWSYSMEIPEQVEPVRLLKSVLGVLLIEMANRDARSSQVELPLWLTEGMTEHLRATAQANFALEPETRLAQKQHGIDPLAGAREQLRTHPPLTLNELNWPTEEQLSEQNAGTYQSCAHLFVSELLRLRDGRACFREMLSRLPQRLNWQTAFLDAFGSHFQRLIDVDKWWSLHVVHFTGQGLSSIWRLEESCRQLDEILSTPVQIRLSKTELPLSAQVRLQSILREWEFARQQPVLMQKLNLLWVLRQRASQDSARLVEDYRQTLEAYLQQRSRTGSSARKTEPPPPAKLVVNETIKRLDLLDTQREALRRQTNTPEAQLTISP